MGGEASNGISEMENVIEVEHFLKEDWCLGEVIYVKYTKYM